MDLVVEARVAKGLPILALLALLLVFTGCASVSTHSRERFGEPTRTIAPEIIYVQGFVTPADVFRVDRPEAEAKDLREEESQRLARNIVWRVRDHILPSSLLPTDAKPPCGNYWLVTGKFVRVNQGSRALRMVIGFGAGGTKVETEVEVFDLSGAVPELVMRFRTTGGSNAQPGAIANTSWFFAGLSGASLAFTGIRFDIARTSREITASLSQELALQGVHPSDKRAMRPKQLGKWP
jgi:hypothetical protein